MQIPRKLRNTLCALLGTIAVSTGCDNSRTVSLYNGKVGNDNVNFTQTFNPNGVLSSQNLSIWKAEGSLELLDEYLGDYKIDKVKIIREGKTTEYSASNATDSTMIEEGQKKFNEYKAKIQEEKPKEDLEFLRNF